MTKELHHSAIQPRTHITLCACPTHRARTKLHTQNQKGFCVWLPIQTSRTK